MSVKVTASPLPKVAGKFHLSEGLKGHISAAEEVTWEGLPWEQSQPDMKQA